MPKSVSHEEFESVCEALWTELQYQDNLPRRTDGEAKDMVYCVIRTRIIRKNHE